VAGQSHSGSGSEDGSVAGRLSREVAALQASLLGKLGEELDGQDPRQVAEAAQRLAEDFGAVTATAVEAAVRGRVATSADPALADTVSSDSASAPPNPASAEHRELTSLYQPGHMRRRLDQLAETNKRYGHPFALAVFDASGPGARNGAAGGGQETALAVVGAALRDSIRIVDEAFRLEEDAICVLAPNLHTVEGMQMAERLLGQLDELERAGGLRISVSAGVVACPDHGADVDALLRKADAAMWRARAVGQPLGIGALQDR
jgi:diguanylate cyclase (GGDEF)-like protein